MPRNVSFDEEAVLAQGAALFWHKGYQATSMRDLTRTTKLHPGSFYHSFGSKRNFFMAVADHYYKQLTKNINIQLQGTDDAIALLRQFFKTIVIADNKLETRGCLLINTLIEVTQDAELQSYLSAMFSGLEELFYWILVKGQKQNHIRPNIDCRSNAKLLVNDYFGLRVQTMTEKNSDELLEIIDFRLRQLSV